MNDGLTTICCFNSVDKVGSELRKVHKNDMFKHSMRSFASGVLAT